MAENGWVAGLRGSRTERVLGWTLGVAAVVWIGASLAAHLVLSASPERVLTRYIANQGFEGPAQGPSLRFVIGMEFWSASVGGKFVTFGGLALLLALRARRSAIAFRTSIGTPA